MVWRLRSFWVAAALVLYLCAAVSRAASDPHRGWIVLVLGPLVLLTGYQLAAPPRVGVDRIDAHARSAARLVASGAAVVLVSFCQ